MAYTTIDDPSEYFQTALWSGSGSGQAITNGGNSDLQPDWAWIKKRAGGSARSHQLYDSTRGVTKLLHSDATDAEQTQSQGLTAFGSDGFTVGTDDGVNGSGGTYVAWQWKANGGTTTTNDASATSVGTIDSVYQANTDAGFSIITYTGDGNDNASFAHGLGAVPNFHIIKRRSGTEDWVVYHHENTSDPNTDHLLLNTPDATSDSDTRYSDAGPSATTITLGNNAVVNANGSTYVCYAFTEKQGYSRFGHYTGNGNSDGPFVYTGFKPAWIMQKNTQGSTNWNIHDNKRSTINTVDDILMANATDAEGAVGGKSIDFLSNGFKLRGSDNETNDNGDVHIYMAFAESPFVSSEGVPTTAR